MTAHQVEEAAGIVPDLLPQLTQGHDLRLALTHGDLLAAAVEAHELDEGRLQALARLSHGDEAGAHPRDIAVMVRPQHVDEAREAALGLAQVIGDIGREVGLLAVLAPHHAILLVPELARPEPGRTVALLETPLGCEHLERMIDGAALGEGALGTPVIEEDAELPEVVADVREHLRERELEHLAETRRAQELPRPPDERIDVELLVASGRIGREPLENARRRPPQSLPGEAAELVRERSHVIAAVAVLREGQLLAADLQATHPGAHREA